MSQDDLHPATLLQGGAGRCALRGRFRVVLPMYARCVPAPPRRAFRGFVVEGTVPDRLPALADAMRGAGDLAPLLAELLTSFPHGPVLLRGTASARNALRRALASLGARVEVAGNGPLEVLLPAYGGP